MKPGDVLAERYRLVARLGAGGMGEVWRAEQTALGRDVALKVVKAELDASSHEARERFKREAALVAKVEHRNVVDILDYGTLGQGDDGAQYLAMPLLHGESLQERLQREPPQVDELLAWVHGVLSGLAAIHAAGIVHRDLKPANVFLARDADGVIPKLLDFGISRANLPGTDLTARGSGMGTPQYMAPEQFESAKDVDASADVWGVGAILYEALSGRRPYEGDDAFAIYKSVLQRPPTPLSTVREDLPAALVNFVARALEREPKDRYADGAEMRQALDRLLSSGELPQGLLAQSVVAGAVVPRTAAMADENDNPVSGDAPTEPAGVLVKDELPAPTVEIEPTGATQPTGGKVPWLLVVAALAVLAVAGALLFDVLRRDPPRPSEATRQTDAGLEVDAGAQNAVLRDAGAASPSATGYLVSEPLELTELAFLWAELGAGAHAGELRFVRRGRAYVAMVPASTEPELLQAFADRFDAPVVPAEWDSATGLRPSLAQTTVRLSLHVSEDLASSVSRVLPHESLVIALDEGAPAEEDSDTRHVLAAVGSEGWVSSRFLEPLEGCLPNFSEVLADLSAELGDRYGEIAPESTRVLTHANLDGRRQRVFMVQASDLAHRESIVRVYRLGRTCSLESIATHRLSGVIDEAFLTETIPGGGHTLLVSSVPPRDTRDTPGLRLWEARPISGGEPIWSARFSTGMALPSRQRGSVVGTRDRIATRRRQPFTLSVRPAGGSRRWLVYRDGQIVDEVTGQADEEDVDEPPSTDD